MIAFGSAITRPDVYDRCARPGIERVREPDSVVLDLASVGSLFASYNAILERAAALDELEALVLLHQDTEIVTPNFCAEARRALADPHVGVVGCVGAVGVRSIAYWEGSMATASFLQRWEEDGGGELEAFSWDWDDAAPYARLGEVDTLDGFLLVLSPWAVENIRFDESLGQFHGYDVDFCLQVRDAGRTVVTADFRAVHHHALEPWTHPESWIAAHVALAEKWDGRIPGFGVQPGTWRERALRAEAEAAASRAVAQTNHLETAAKARELERAVAETTTSLSWRLTAPLRRARAPR
jgi:hypothetical protein